MKHLKLFFALFAMLALGVGNVWAAEVILDGTASNLTTTATSAEGTFTQDGISYIFSKGAKSIAVQSTAANEFSGTTKTIYIGKANTYIYNTTPFGKRITKFEIYSNKGASTNVKVSVSFSETKITSAKTTPDYSDQLRTEDKVYEVTNIPAGAKYFYYTVTSAHNSQVAFRITYEEGSEEPVVKTLKSIAVEGMTTEYEIGDVFEFDGTCTATYSVTQNSVPQEDETAVVTPANVTEPDMSTAGTKEVTVTYTEGEITKTFSYNITVSNALPKIVITQNEVAEFTNTYAEYTWTASGVSGKIYGYKNSGMQLNSSKDGSYVYNTDPIPGYIRKIKIVKASGTTHNWTPYVSETALTSAGGTTLDQKEVAATTTWEESGENSYFYLLESGGATVIESITIYYEAVVPQVAAPTFNLEAGTYNAVQNVTISAEEGATIHYTLDGQNPTTESPVYSTPIEIAETKTLKAIAVKDEKVSPIASATYTIKLPLTTMDQIFAKATAVGSTATPVDITMNNWVVTGVKNNNVYVTDGTKGLIIYTASHGFNVSDILSGTVACKVQLFKGSAELTELTSTAEGLTVSSGGEVTPVEVADISSLTGANTGSVIKITGVHDKNNIISGVKLYNALYEFNDLTSGKKYSVTGVYLLYEETQEILPRSEADIVEVPVPTLSATITNADFGKIAIKGKAERTLTLNGSLLTKPVSLAIEGDYFELEFDEVTPTEDKIENAKIKITYKPTAEGTHTATLKITSDDVAEQKITLTGQAAQEYTVHFYVNGDEDETLKKTVLSGNTLEELPEATSCDLLNYPTFAGWASAEIVGTTDLKPTMLDQSTPITSDCNYYAVFAKGTTSSGTANTSYELVILPSHFTTSYNERSFTATANEVDGEGTLKVSLTSAGVMKSTDTSKGNPIQFRKKSSSTSPGTIYNTIDLEQINSISYADGTNNIASTIIGASQQPTEQEDGKGFFMITNGTSVSYIPSITINFTKTSVSEITTYEYITSCAAVVPICEITYDYADGEGECTNDIVEEGAEYTLCATAPTKTGHTFLNWKDQNGTEYVAGAKISSVTEDLTLTAQWQVNSYSVTWMSLGSKLSSSDVNYNTQPTKPATNPTYLCGTGKEFVGWTTQEIDGAGVPANLYTDEFPVVTEAITYHAVFASINSSAESTTHTLTPNNSWSGYAEGTITDNKGYTWSYCAAGTKTDGVYSLNLRNKDTETSYIGSPLFTANVKNIKATIVNGSASKERKVYVCSAPTLEPTTGDLGITEVAGGHSGELSLAFEGTISQFYLQVSDALQFQSIKVEVGEAPYIDYVTSCEEVGSDMSNSTKVTPSVESGIFSVGAGKYVQFSTGNLQYEVGTNTWSFASEQYEVIGNEAYNGTNNTNYGMNEPGYTGKLDLFGWSSDGKFGVNPSNTDANYEEAFVEWGKLVNETGWYTLTKEEMNHILARTKDGKKLWALATVCDMNGLILLPDNWNTSTTLEYGYIPTDWNYTKNQFDAAAWATLEAAGAVFLPEGGSRVGGHGNRDQGGGPAEFDTHGDYFHVDNVGEMGYYWLNTQDTRTGYENYASFLILPGWNDNGTPNIENDDICLQPQVWSREKRRGNSVRLVKAIEPTYTRDDQTSGAYGTVCYEKDIVWCDGATLYEVAGKEGNKVIFDEVTTPEAGMPYIFIAEKEKVNFFCGSATATEAGEHNSLQGTFTQIDPAVDNILVDNYMLVNNIIKKCGINCGLYANRAYFVADDLENMDKAPAAAPGRRRISLDVTSENTTTGLDNITNGEDTTIKVIENGQLIIIRNGEKYNAQGVRL